MTKKKERVFETPEEEIKFLRKQVAGLKGRNATLVKIEAHLETDIADLRDKYVTVAKDNDRLREALRQARRETPKRRWWHWW